MPLLLCAIAAFVFYPATGNQISIASGFNRIALAVIVILIVFGFYKCAPPLPNAIGRRLKDLGAATYGIYLLHPVVTTWTRTLLDRLGLDTLPSCSPVRWWSPRSCWRSCCSAMSRHRVFDWASG